MPRTVVTNEQWAALGSRLDTQLISDDMFVCPSARCVQVHAGFVVDLNFLVASLSPRQAVVDCIAEFFEAKASFGVATLDVASSNHVDDGAQACTCECKKLA